MKRFALTSMIALVLLAAHLSAQIENSDCLDCHENAMGEVTGTFNGALDYSIHQGFSCTDCHTAITDLPHSEDSVPKVKCGDCHESESDEYVWHGRMKRVDCADIPCCADCHGRHDIRPSADRDSRVNPLHLPETCGRCHENLDLIKKHDLVEGKAIRMYQSSVHGQASLGGVYFAATCNDCHSAKGSAHRILSPGHPESPINHFNIPKTCGKCHQNVENDYWEGIHGQLVARGETDSPVCTNCHGEHGIIAPSDPKSPVSPSRVAEATCSPCHESAFINEKYGLPTGRLQTWYDSYHGLKSKAGDRTVANCSSCHGAHRILPHTNKTSSIHPDNLQKTCGHCHPGISAEMAATPIHEAPGTSQTPIANIVAMIYIVIIFVTIGAMVLHWLIDLRKQIWLLNQKKQVKRMNFNAVWQHMFLMISFTTLVITGFALRFSDAFWVQWLFGWEGGFPLRGTIHRVAAVIFVMTVIWHLLYLTTRKGHEFLRDIFPRKTDLGQIVGMLLYNLGLQKDKPQFERFSYIEKAEYWALVWGSVIMIITGFFLWFDNIAVQFFPKGFLDVMLVIHYYEAWLAMLAILVWHMYSTVFNPGVYPMNPSWFTGKMPLDAYVHEHPGDKAFLIDSDNGNDRKSKDDHSKRHGDHKEH
ncbi:MAG: cytochrome b/b6 domain-containing protein [Candidatus Zixiibacteriota bacterium]